MTTRTRKKAITGKNFAGHEMKLYDTKTNRPLNEGDRVTTFRGERVTLRGGHPPHKPESSGRIYVSENGRDEFTYYPGVIDAEWRSI